ncbi:N-6 DNA methylase [Asticcacaulis sp.]|uniref:restriction endonuclease subunit M n=1 Tax=Asticcacaulis sp. TaxID=1872648 RepID=UPI0026245193|nr:N-6 DNA methylase [Asticcacaulis sp.]
MARPKKGSQGTKIDIHTTMEEPDIDISPDENSDDVDAIAAGYVKDYVSGLSIKATPEEVEATQVFAKRLVEDFGYPKSRLITRPQYRVRRRPSDEKKSYPVDIAVFSDDTKHDDKCLMIVECKAENVKSGRKQLELYLSLSDAPIGVWFNGKSHLYLHKQYVGQGRLSFTELPTLPRCGQRIEDIGRYLRKDLQATNHLKSVLKDIRHHLAGNLKGITKDERLAQQIINILFCKIYDETTKGPEELMSFRAGVGEDSKVVRDRIIELFSRVKNRFSDVFDPTEAIELDDENIAYVVGELQTYCITDAERDVVADAFEVFMGPALRGEEGQFFTPRNVVRMIIDIVDPKPEELIIDPACGSGGFLVGALDYVWRKIEVDGAARGLSKDRIREEQRHVGSRFFRGMDKDAFLAKVAKAYMAILGDGRGGVFCDNSLLPTDRWEPMAQSAIQLGKFDIVMTNPPFGTKIPIKGADTLGQYDLGHQYKKDKASGRYTKTTKLHEKQPPQILFIERCLQLLKPGGRMGIVIPESILGMPTYTHIVQYLRERVRIVGVVSMPEELFQPHTHAKTAVMFVKKIPPSDGDQIFMSVVEWCGHDSRGNPTIRTKDDGTEELLDDVPAAAKAFRTMIKDFC